MCEGKTDSGDRTDYRPASTMDMLLGNVETIGQMRERIEVAPLQPERNADPLGKVDLERQRRVDGELFRQLLLVVWTSLAIDLTCFLFCLFSRASWCVGGYLGTNVLVGIGFVIDLIVAIGLSVRCRWARVAYFLVTVPYLMLLAFGNDYSVKDESLVVQVLNCLQVALFLWVLWLLLHSGIGRALRPLRMSKADWLKVVAVSCACYLGMWLWNPLLAWRFSEFRSFHDGLIAAQEGSTTGEGVVRNNVYVLFSEGLENDDVPGCYCALHDAGVVASAVFGRKDLGADEELMQGVRTLSEGRPAAARAYLRAFIKTLPDSRIERLHADAERRCPEYAEELLSWLGMGQCSPQQPVSVRDNRPWFWADPRRWN